MTPPEFEAAEDAALVALLRELKRRGYGFVTPTPETHRRVVSRPDRRTARDVRDVLGWSLPVGPGVLDDELLALLEHADVVEKQDGLLRSRVRVSSLGSNLYVHSAFPTTHADSVFFGPDSYRFAALIEAELRGREVTGTVVDIGTGAGVGAMVARRLVPQARAIGTDLNSQALRFAAINAAAADLPLETVLTESLDAIAEPIAVALANPPYIVDPEGRDYRDGGDDGGGEVSMEMTRAALPRLSDGGMFVLYTGSTIIDGQDRLELQLRETAREHDCSFRYREIDPDVFGEELSNPGYRHAERIAVVAAVFERP